MISKRPTFRRWPRSLSQHKHTINNATGLENKRYCCECRAGQVQSVDQLYSTLEYFNIICIVVWLLGLHDEVSKKKMDWETLWIYILVKQTLAQVIHVYWISYDADMIQISNRTHILMLFFLCLHCFRRWPWVSTDRIPGLVRASYSEASNFLHHKNQHSLATDRI